MELIENINFDINALSDLVLSWLLSSGIRIVFILLGMIILLKLAGLFSRKIFSVVQKNKDNIEAVKRTDTLSAIVRYILKVSILVVSALLILGEIGIEIGPILAAAGVLGLAVGFGAQSLVKDVISGFFILLEDQIRVGDVIIIVVKPDWSKRLTSVYLPCEIWRGGFIMFPMARLMWLQILPKNFPIMYSI